MLQSLLYFGNVRVMREGIGRSGGAQRMDTKAVYIGVDTDHSTVMPDNLLIHGSWVQVLGKNLCRIVFHWPEQGAVEIKFVLSLFQILGDESLRFEAHRDV